MSVSEWVHVSDRLPVDRIAVIVWCPVRFNKYMANRIDGDWYHFGGYGKVIEDVTHWMATPNPPDTPEVRLLDQKE